MTMDASAKPVASPAPWPSAGASAYLMIVLTIASMNSYIDRIILSLMINGK